MPSEGQIGSPQNPAEPPEPEASGPPTAVAQPVLVLGRNCVMNIHSAARLTNRSAWSLSEGRNLHSNSLVSIIN